MRKVKNMGRVKAPAAAPERQRALARDRFLSKYLAVRMIPGVVARPTPAPVSRPRVRKSVSRLGMKAERVIPVKASRLPPRLTQRQLSRWQRAEAIGAIAKAVVVMAAGIQEVTWTKTQLQIFG